MVSFIATVPLKSILGDKLMQSPSREIESVRAVASPKVVLLGSLAILFGAFAAVMVLPAWLPWLTFSMVGETPKVFWYLSRGTALVGFILLWLSMIFGIMITNRLARLWPGGPAAYDLHQYVSLVGLGFGFFHPLILLGDRFLKPTLMEILLPFTMGQYRPLWVGSFYVRKQLGNTSWRLVHYTSFLTFVFVLAHGIFSGTDSGSASTSLLYWIAAASTLLLLFYRVLTTVGTRRIASQRSKN
jgi:predicted ferric reductase